MEINEVLFTVLLCASFVIGVVFGVLSVREYRKSLEKEYKQKHDEIYNTIRKETKGEWSKGWDAAYRSIGNRQKAFHLWFREHGYELEDIDDWYEKYMKK